MRELYWMAEAARRERWDHTSHMLTLFANIHRDPKKQRAFVPADFNPFAPEKKPSDSEYKPNVIPANITVLKDLFVKDQPPQERRPTEPVKGG